MTFLLHRLNAPANNLAGTRPNLYVATINILLGMQQFESLISTNVVLHFKRA